MNAQCPKCNSHNCIKSGFTLQKKQRFYCKNCHKKFLMSYTYHAYFSRINHQIVVLLKEGVGMRSICRILGIALNTLTSRILKISKEIKAPIISKGNAYEVDEIRTFVKKKTSLIWIVYALERASKKVVSYAVGNRTNNTLSTVINQVISYCPRKIFTDKLKHYKFLIPESIHRIIPRATNSIERNNLTMRTHLKILNRKTICFSRCTNMLIAILRIYFWYPNSINKRPFYGTTF